MSRFNYWSLVAAATMLFGEIAPKDAPWWHFVLFGMFVGFAVPSSRPKP